MADEEKGYTPEYNTEDIPDGDAPPTSGNDGLWLQLDGKLKLFKFRTRGSEQYTYINHIKGIWVKTRQTWDPDGNPSHDVGPGWRLAVFLETKELGLVQVRVSSKAAYCSLVKSLQGVARGSILDLIAVPFEKGCFINASIWTGHAWNELRGMALPGDTPEQRYQSAVEIARTLGGYDEENSDVAPHFNSRRKDTAQSSSSSLGAEKAQFIRLCAESGWPPFIENRAAYEAWFGRAAGDQFLEIDNLNEASWLTFAGYVHKINQSGAPRPRELRDIPVYDPLFDDGETVTPAPTRTAAPAAVAHSAPVQTSGAVSPARAATPVAAAPVDAPGELIAFGTADASVPPDKEAYGWKPARWFTPMMASAQGTAVQKSNFFVKCSEKGLSADQARKLMGGIVLSLEFPRASFYTMGAFQVATDFITAASPQQIEAACFDGGEYDPFANS